MSVSEQVNTSEKIIELIRDIVKPTQAEYSYGTLYVRCTTDQSQDILQRLEQHYGASRIVMNKVNVEYSYQFLF
jgi:hypothetical protein